MPHKMQLIFTRAYCMFHNLFMGQSINPYKLKIAGQIGVFKLMDLCNIPDARKPASAVMVMSISFRLNSS